MNERIKQLRQDPSINLSQEAFGKKIGVTGAAISRIEAGTRKITDQMILAICREFRVSYEWLTIGEGEMFEDLPQTAVDELAEKYHLTASEKKILADYIALPDEQRALIRSYLKKVFQALSLDDEEKNT